MTPMLPGQPRGSNESGQRPRTFFPRAFSEVLGGARPGFVGHSVNSCFKAPGFVVTEYFGTSWIVIDQID